MNWMEGRWKESLTYKKKERGEDQHQEEYDQEKGRNSDNEEESQQIANDEEELHNTTRFDVAIWPAPMPDDLRVEIVKTGSEPYQNRDGPFLDTVQRSGDKIKEKSRHFNSEWFYKALPNGEKSFVNGFNSWWKLNPKVSEHENSESHLSCFEKWKILENGLRLQKTIDHEHQMVLDQEKKKWRDILSRLLDVILFLARQNLPLRGHREGISSDNRENFLELVNLLSKYDPVLKEHMLRIEHAIACTKSKRVDSYLSKDIQNEFISIFWGKRYVHIEGDDVEVKESFLGFFPIAGKTAVELTENILTQLEGDNLDTHLCRAQGYDNAATMAGVHGGVQAIIKEHNPKALFMPCANHSLNLCGVHSFGSKLVSTLEDMCDPSSSRENADTREAAPTLLPALCDFSFLCYLSFFGVKSQKKLTRHKMERAISYATEKCEDLDISIERRGRRRFRKRMPGEMARDAGLTLPEGLQRAMLECLDRFYEELEHRYKAMDDILITFGVVQPTTLLTSTEEELRDIVLNLTKIYDELCAEDIILEILQLRRHLEAASISLQEAVQWTTLELLKFIVKWDYSECSKSSAVSKIFLTICVSVASCDRSFSKLKLIKSYLRSTRSQTRLTSLSILSIEKARKVNLGVSLKWVTPGADCRRRLSLVTPLTILVICQYEHTIHVDPRNSDLDTVLDLVATKTSSDSIRD
ncbi:Zinc finger MYM-type protein 1 [Eumeta japonica]|uniref:Zinc finger MYM-type protein 1 n=1 Tax=Eumeta variegata TaxID=151549 RepID=A0A4C1YE98_EUMVA|nr:Zinc finger MYM-type protein 1 [Eumeta japonica]